MTLANLNENYKRLRKKKNFKRRLWKKIVHKLLAINRNQLRDQDLQGRRIRGNTTLLAKNKPGNELFFVFNTKIEIFSFVVYFYSFL